MNKKLLTIAIALVIFVIVASPVSALPTKSPLPPGNPWNLVWGLFQELQNQITANFANLQEQITALKAKDTALEAKDTNLQNQINNIPGPVHFGEWQKIEGDYQAGLYTSGDPSETDGFVRFMCTGDEETYIYGFIGEYLNGDVIAYDKSPEYPSSPGFFSSPTSIIFPVQQGKKWGVKWGTCELKFDIAWLPLSA